MGEVEETLDLAPAFGIVGRAQETLDAQAGAGGVELFGGVDLGLVDVDGQGAAVAEDGAFEAVFQARELLVPYRTGRGGRGWCGL